MNQCKGDPLSGIGSIAEANSKLPRKVRFDQTSARAVCIALLVFLVGVIGYTWICFETLRTIHLRDILRQEGVIANGVVTASNLNHGGVSVKYRFEVDGVSYSGQAEMKGSHYRAPVLGQAIQVLYLLNKPDASLPSDWEWFSIWDIVPFLFVMFTAIASGAVITVALREVQLARSGIVVEGKVTGCLSNQKTSTVYYEFRTEDDVLMEGSGDTTEDWESGASIPVIYLRSNPKRNERYPVAGILVAE